MRTTPSTDDALDVVADPALHQRLDSDRARARSAALFSVGEIDHQDVGLGAAASRPRSSRPRARGAAEGWRPRRPRRRGAAKRLWLMDLAEVENAMRILP
jgi:hypothetical protein